MLVGASHVDRSPRAAPQAVRLPVSVPRTLPARGPVDVPPSSRPVQRPSSARSRAVGALLCALSAAGCFTSAELRDRADSDALSRIEARRALLFGDVEPFALPAATSAFGRDDAFVVGSTLRDRILGRTVDEVGAINLLDALLIAGENSQRVQEEKESLYLAALALTEEEWRFGYRYTADGAATASGDVGGDLVPVNAGFGASVTRILGSGATVLANVGSDLFRFVSTGDGWDAVTNLGLSITQPLLRGSGRLVTLEPLRQTERNLIYAVRDYERFRRTFSRTVAGQVFALLRNRDQLNNEQRNFDNLVTLSKRNEALAEAGDLSEIQVDQARQQELLSESELVRLQGDLEFAQDSFNVFLGLPVGVALELEATLLQELDADPSFLEGLDQDAVVAFALENRLDVMTSFDRMQDTIRREAIARDALRTGLGLTAGANSNSDSGRPLGHSIDDATFNVAVTADLPVDLLPLRNAWRRAEIAVVDQRRSYERFLDSVSVSVRDALRRARNASRSFEIQRGAVALSERRYAGADLSNRAGRASTRDVLEAQADLLSVRNALTRERITFTLALYDLWLELELLRVDERGIHVDEELQAELRARLPQPAAPAPAGEPPMAPETETGNGPGDDR